MKDQQIALGPFRLDEANECLWHEKRAISLRPKAYAVLRYLVQHPGILVTKQQLLDDVWPNTFVSDAVLKDCIRQLREAFGDEAKSPQYIETAHRRGYRFIGPIRANEPILVPTENQKAEKFNAYPLPLPTPADMSILGREEALAQMMDWLDKALAAQTQVVFVTGEAGIGKTTVVEAFLQQARRLQDILIARGQCLEQYGAGEAYLPVLECLSRLARGTVRGRMIELLRANAPTWLAQMPSLTTSVERETLQEEVAGATRERMLREMSETVESLTLESPLVLVLEDLHWSDLSTLDLISYLARGRHPSRLMLIGTYRPVEVILNDHPLKDVKLELQMHKLCHELPLEYLTPEVVAEFLNLKFPAHQFPAGLPPMIHHRTEGNPLFMVNLIEYLVDEKVIVNRDGNWRLQADLGEVELGVPENMRYMIEKHIERLTPEEQRVLEGASVVGMDCSAAAMAAGLDDDVIKIEEICDGLARRQHFFRPAYLAELPDGTITPRYKFIHSLYLDVLYRRVAPTRRSQIHGRIGERGEEIYGERVSEIAAELAVHFEQARDSERAVKYLLMAAENAARRSADHEVISLVRRGLEILETLPGTKENETLKLSLQERLLQSGEADAGVLH